MRRLFSLLICLVAASSVFAQVEVCDDGLDNDNDGFVDCYDPDCASFAGCDDIFVGNNGCQIDPPPAPAFTMQLDFSSPNQTTNHLSRLVIGDLDRDGMPEIVTMNKYTKRLFILRGSDGSIKFQATMNSGATPEWEIATANINDDNCAEIFFLATDRRIYVYDCSLNFLYRTNAMPSDPINFGLADFDGDGLVELYCKDQIFDAHSGRRLVQTTFAGNWGSELNGGPVAVNMDADPQLELVLGLSIYDVNIPAGRGTDLGSLSAPITPPATAPAYFIRNSYNATSVADFNQDGTLDVIASGSTGCHGKNTTIFYWNRLANTVQTYSDHNSIPADNDYNEGWQNGTGRVNIADLDGDGQLNLSYVSGGFLYALQEDMTRLWRVAINEETSGYTGCTLFDFNGDGQSEIVYRDEQYIYIINGTDGSIFSSQNCVSRTNREYPIVADLDADGSTEICVTCGFNDASALDDFNTIDSSRWSHVRVFESAAEPWVPARRVWNQHGYFVVNVNDDLSIPRVQQSHNKLFSTTACRVGDPVTQHRPLNKFLNQSPYLDTRGCPLYSAPDIKIDTVSIAVVSPVCPELDFQISFNLFNNGDVPFTGNYPISFYDADPDLPGATKLATITYTIPNLGTGDVFAISETITSNGSGSLFIVLNDAGTTIPTPISLPNTSVTECIYDAPYEVAIVALPVALTAVITSEHENCAAPPTGSARAFVLTAGVENTSDYDFYWFDGATAGPIDSADFTGSIYAGIVNGPYQVYAIHKTANCSSDTTQADVPLASGTGLPTVTVTLVSDQTSCNPPNGSLQATVAGPGGNAGYTFDWEDIGGPIGISGATLSNQQAGTYTVVVSKNGCQATTDGTIGDQTIEPDVNAVATHIVSCNNISSGSVSATALLSGVPQSPALYTFDWYLYDTAIATRGSVLPPIHGTGPTRTGLPVGFYEVVATLTSTQCASPSPYTVEILDNTVVPEVAITELAPQTSCDPSNPNGRLQALVTVAGVPQPASNFTFQWFVGQNTLPANLHASVSGTNGSIAEDVKGGGQAYTVKVTTADNCSAVADTVVTETLNLPIVTLAANPNGVCNAALAIGDFTGSVTATVTFGGAPVVFPNPNYSFEWYNGTQAIGVPRTENTFTLTQLDSGFYTVVVKRTDLGCDATPETEQVTNTTVLPVITADADSSTNCLPLLSGVIPNGQAKVTRVDGINQPTANYTFSWHRGTDQFGPSVGLDPINIAASRDTLQGAAGKFYTVLVTNVNDGCQNTRTVEVTDAHALPLVTLAPFPNNICSPATSFNGRVESTITNQGANPIADYRFTWTDLETSTQVLQAVGTAGEDLLNRDSSDYLVVVRQITTGCESNPAQAQVTSSKVLPNITAIATPSTNCIPLLPGVTPDGQAIVTRVDGINQPTSAYTFSWHRGTNQFGPSVGIDPLNVAASRDTLQGAVGKFYTVLVTNTVDGCQNTSTVEVTDDHELPVITLSSTPNTICNGTPDGKAFLATLNDRGVSIPAPYTGYTFGWETPPGSGTDTLFNLPLGNYSLKVRNISRGCFSDSESIDVDENFFTPPIDIAAQNQTSCDVLNRNGELAATINETTIGGAASTTTGYNFSWENNGNPFASPGTGAGATATINSLRGNLFYTVTVERIATGCTNTESIFLPETITYPVVAAAVSSNVTRCDTPDGSVVANVGGTDTGFTFFWLNEVGTNQTADDTTVVDNADAFFTDNGDYLNLIPGYYTVVARDDNTACLSQPVTRIVSDNTIQSVITITPDPNFLPASCLAANGRMSATVTGGVGPFDLFWHNGGPVNDSINFVNNPPQFTPPNDVPFEVILGSSVTNLTNLRSGIYSLVVQDNGNGCGNYETIFLPFQNAQAILETLTPSTLCPYTIGNGVIEVVVDSIPTAPPGLTFQDFSYQLYKGENPDPAQLVVPPGLVGPGASVTNPMVYSSLAPGKYTIEVRQEFSARCRAYEVVEIEAHAFSPVVDIAGTVANTACDVLTAADGEATIQVNIDPNDQTTGFTYNIDVTPNPLGTGDGSIGPYLPPPLPDTYTITGLRPSNVVLEYTVRVTNPVSQCFTEKVVSIPNQPAIAEILNGAVNVLPALYCDAALETNAQAEVTSLSIIGGGVDNLNDYEFDWFTDAGLTTLVLTNQDGVSGASKGGEVLSNVDAPLPTSSVTFGSYWVVATKEDVGTTGGVGCFSAPFKVDILDNTEDPTIALTSSSNTSCDSNFEGAIQVEVTNPGSVPATTNYSYTWTTAVTPITPPPTSNGDGLLADDNFASLQEGLYIVDALNIASGCTTTSQVTLLKTSVPIIVPTATSIAQNICDPAGSITVDSVMVGTVRETNHMDFSFKWYKDVSTLGTEIIPIVAGNDILDVADLPTTMGAGTYFVRAQRTTGSPASGCESAPFRIEVLDTSLDPIARLTPTPNTACDANFEGAIQVEMTSSGSVTAALGYTYTWTSFVTDPTPSTPPTSNGDGLLADDNFTELNDGVYILQIENNSSGCITTSQTTITESAIPIIVATANPIDQMICNPDGSITVIEVLVGGTPDPVHGNFDFKWYKDDPTTTEIVPIVAGNDVLDIIDLPLTIGTGTYFVKASRGTNIPFGSGCESAPLRVDILDRSEDPDLDFASVRSDSSCNVLNPLGLILATASERDATIDNYTFAWAYNSGAINPPTTQTDVSPNSQLNNAAAGNYVVVVTNTITGCTFNQGVALTLDTTRSLPNIVNITPTNPLNCFPVGSAQVVQIIIGGTRTLNNPPDDIDATFDYQWYKGSVPAGQLVGEVNSGLLNQLPGRYFVSVEDLSTSCTSSLIEIVIDSADIVYPDVKTRQTSPQVICDVVNLGGSAMLVATVDLTKPVNSRNSLANYDLFWYPNLDTLGAQINPVSDTTINNQLAGNFSVKVFDRTTNCRAKAIFVIENDSTEFKPNLALTSGPLTECDSIDGSIQARGLHFNFPFNSNTPPGDVYPFTYNYTADFYTGSPADLNNPGPDLPNVPAIPGPPAERFLQPNLPIALYTVRMTDVNTGCSSVDTISVRDMRVFPTPEIIAIAPVTNCDPLNPNGVARALVNGSFVGYRFEWFEGTVPTGLPLYTGAEYGDLKVTPTVYTVRATNVITGCSDSTQTSIDDGTVDILMPTIEILSHVTSCDVTNPNGALTASVDGNSFAYIFDWYDGTQEVPPPDFTGEIYNDLPAGLYGVTATSKITGCKSPIETEQIILDQDFPDLEFTVQNATCGQNNGSASLIITTDVAIDNIVWYDQPFDVEPKTIVTEGPNLYEAIAGQYSVLVTTILGCSSHKDIEITTEIRPFNGISRGSTPDQNDYFHIDCIDNFPQNVVKIYNRAGTLVYEGHGYDNVDTYFDGKSNKGVSPMGTNLPDGTYFYVVDKNDGSKSVAGYLEIVK